MGASLFYYSAIFPFMPHAVSFVLLVLVMRMSRRISIDVTTNRSLALLGLCLAAILLVRPQQVLVGFFMLPQLIRVLRSRPASQWILGSTLGMTACVAAMVAQLVMNYSQF